MAIIYLLVLLAGAAMFVGLLHVLTGLRTDRRGRHLFLGGLALSLAGYILLAVALYQTDSLDAYGAITKVQSALSAVLLCLAWWFVAFYTEIWPRVVLWGATALSALALALNQIAPVGLFFSRIEALQHVQAGATVLTVPVGTPNVWEWTLKLSFLGFLAFSIYALRRQYVRGQRGPAVLLGIALIAASAPALVDVFVLGAEVLPFPYTELGFFFLVATTSLGLTDGAVHLARTQQALEASESRARALVEGAPDGIAIVDLDGPTLVELNPAGRRLLGLGEGEGLPPLNEVSPLKQSGGRDSWETGRALLEAAGRGEAQTLEWTFRRRDGSIFDAEIWLTPLPVDGGQRLVRVSFLDLTERKAAQAREDELALQLQQAQKLETLGTLAGGIAHDFNNLLTPITGYVDLAMDEEELAEDSPIRDYLDAVGEAATRARELVQQILVFSRRMPSRPAASNLQDAVEHSLKLFESGKPASVRLRLALSDPTVCVGLSETQIQQIIMNLATNAMHAMPDGGDLSLSVEARPDDEGGPWAVLSVGDTGTGMDPDLVDRIFDPFFTTKPTGVGTGLGLSVVHGIVTGAGGHIEVDSVSGEGTVFRLFLPTAEVGAGLDADATGVGTTDRRLRVLVVEDDLSTLETLRRMVSRVGHQAIAESEPTRALERIGNTSEPLDLVLVGYDMPVMNGEVFARRVRTLRPDLALFCISGAALPEDVRGLFHQVVPKPITLADLRQALGTPAVENGAG